MGFNAIAIPIVQSSNHTAVTSTLVLIETKISSSASNFKQYQHIQQALYKSWTTFHPASVNLPNARHGQPGLPSQPLSVNGASATVVRS